MPDAPKKYAEQMVDWLRKLGYTHCFFVAGGNIMHLLDAVRTPMTCIPTVHEVAAGWRPSTSTRRAARAAGSSPLVTAGARPDEHRHRGRRGWLESRELLVLGGQVKSADLATDDVRQRGIQEVDGVSVVAPLTVRTIRIERPVAYDVFADAVDRRQAPAPRARLPRGLPRCSGCSCRAGRGSRALPTVGSPPAPTPTSAPRCSASSAGRSGPCSCSAAVSHAPPRRAVLPDLERRAYP